MINLSSNVVPYLPHVKPHLYQLGGMENQTPQKWGEISDFSTGSPYWVVHSVLS